jgi:hypothetical protein
MKGRKEHKMRKPIYLIGACALIAVATFLWLQPALLVAHVDAVSASYLPLQSTLKADTPATSGISPTELTLDNKTSLRVEQWDAF